MTDTPTSELTVIINRTLDAVKIAENLNERELAARCGVHTSSIYRWRNGQNLCKAATTLIPLVDQYRQSSGQ